MTRMVSKSRFKPKALEYFRSVQQTGQPLVITEHGKPVLKIVSYTAPLDDPLAALRGSVLRYDEPEEPVDTEEWEALR